MTTLKLKNKTTIEIQNLLNTIDWAGVEFKSVSTYENIKEVAINKEIKNGKSKRTVTFFVDGKKVHNHDRYNAEVLMSEFCCEAKTEQTVIIKIN